MSDSLAAYRAKRSPDRTPEPFDEGGSATGRLYVMQKHAARNLHYDLRLELAGVLKSWAVPKDPSYDQKVKRAAFMVEDHPVEYATFEGVIPKGNYGAGEVIVWDQGTWLPLEDPHTGLEKGKLLFELRGHRMRGRWTLVKVKRGENEWLLIKERDALEGEDRDSFAHDSILTGRTLEDLRNGTDVAGSIQSRVEELDAPRRKVATSDIKVMLAETRKEAFDHDDWVFELKYDGYRVIGGRTGDEIALRSRNGNDMARALPDITELTAVGARIAEDLETLSNRVDLAFTEETALRIRQTIENIEGISQQLTGFVEQQTQTYASMGDNMLVATQNVAEVSATVERIAGGVEQEVPLIVANARQASENLEELSLRIQAATEGLPTFVARADTTLQVVSGVAQSVDAMVRQLEPQMTEVGPLIAEARLAVASLQRASERIENGEGTLGRLLEDPALYEETQAAIATLRRLMADMQANPGKYIGTFRLF